jgi:hypothetical protein
MSVSTTDTTEQVESLPNQTPWRDRGLLSDLYWKDELTQKEIAERFGCCERTIVKWMSRLKVPTTHDIGVCHHIEERDGELEYEKWMENGCRTSVLVHRLLAVAEYGFEAVAGSEVNHRNKRRFDNRPANLELLSESDHSDLHTNEVWTEEDGFPVLLN